MTPDQQSTAADQPWQSALDPRLLERLLRPRERPGVITSEVGGAILARLGRSAGGLPLLASLARRLGSAEGSGVGQAPIAYAQPAPPAASPIATIEQPPASRQIVQPIAVQRQVDQRSGVGASAWHGAERPIVHARQARRAEVRAESAAGAAAYPQPAAIHGVSQVAPPTPAPGSNRIVLPPGRLRKDGGGPGASASPAQPLALPRAAPNQAIQRSADTSQSSPLAPSMAHGGPSARAPQGNQTTHPAEERRLPLVRPLRPGDPARVIQRRPGPAALAASPAAPAVPLVRPPGSAPPDRGPPIAAPTPARPIVVSAVPAGRPAQPTPLVLPRPAAEPAAAPAAHTALLGQAAEPATGQAPAAVLPTISASRLAPGVDATQVAAQVYELLVRRLARERERRGG
jgi:hypothetical protein